jgi:hypothetical protein
MQGREDITILRVDAELERKRLRASEMDIRKINERIRRMERRVDDAARALRYDQIQLEAAREYLADVEARHWALLRLYDPNRIENVVQEALRELEENEPAVRRIKEKKSMNESGTTD